MANAITWTAAASDPENDPVSYRFLLNDTPATEWQTQNQWTWTAAEAGTSQITVQVKDENHAGPEGITGNKTAEFTIIAPTPEPASVEAVTGQAQRIASRKRPVAR